MRKVLIFAFVVLTFALTGAAQEKKIQVAERNFHVEPVTIKQTTALRGRFQASAVNSENAVELYLMSAGNLEKWRKDKPASFYYQSARGTSGDFFIRLRPGTYFLVVNNRFSLMDKTVTLTIH